MDKSSQLFDEYVPEVWENYKDQLTGNDLNALKQVTNHISGDINKELRTELKAIYSGTKILTKVILLKKGRCSLMEGLTCKWLGGKDYLKRQMFQNDEYYLIVYTFFLPELNDDEE